MIGKEDPMLARGSEKMLSTGFQIAYGFIAVVDELRSYKEEAMTLFDYRWKIARSGMFVNILYISDIHTHIMHAIHLFPQNGAFCSRP